MIIRLSQVLPFWKISLNLAHLGLGKSQPFTSRAVCGVGVVQKRPEPATHRPENFSVAEAEPRRETNFPEGGCGSHEKVRPFRAAYPRKIVYFLPKFIH